MILRSFSIEDIEKHKEIINSAVKHIKTVAPGLEIEVNIKESYRNMYTVLKEYPEIIETLKKASIDLGGVANISPIRGGTDGARLSFMGLPCPNIFAGGVNFHSKKEWLSLENMALASALLIKIIENNNN